MASYGPSSLILIVIVVAVALTGYLRELLLANIFGVGGEMDAFYLALALVQTMHDLLFAGALTASVIPLLHGMGIDNPATKDSRARFVATAAIVVLATAVAAAVLLRLAMPALLNTMTPELTVATRDTALSLAGVLVWAVPLNALSTLLILVLNAHKRFAIAALTYLTSNLIFIVIVFALSPRMGVQALPIAIIAGSILNVFLLMVQTFHHGLLRAVVPDLSMNFFGPVWRHSRALLISLGIGSTIGLLILTQLIARSFAARHGPGGISALGYAFRLYEVPISLIVNPAGTILFPVVASLFIEARNQKIADVTNAVLMWGLILLFPVAVITAGGAEPIVHYILERGKFDAAATHLTAEALRGFAPAIIVESVFVLFFRIFYAMHRPGWPVWISAFSLAALILMLIATQDGPFLLVPLSVSLAFTLAAICIIFLLVRHLGRSAVPTWDDVGRWAVGAFGAVAIWLLARASFSPGAAKELLALLVFCGAYIGTLALSMPAYRRQLLNYLSRVASPWSKHR